MRHRSIRVTLSFHCYSRVRGNDGNCKAALIGAPHALLSYVLSNPSRTPRHSRRPKSKPTRGRLMAKAAARPMYLGLR